MRAWGRETRVPCESPRSDPSCTTERRQCLVLMYVLSENRHKGWHAECRPMSRPEKEQYTPQLTRPFNANCGWRTCGDVQALQFVIKRDQPSEWPLLAPLALVISWSPPTCRRAIIKDVWRQPPSCLKGETYRRRVFSLRESGAVPFSSPLPLLRPHLGFSFWHASSVRSACRRRPSSSSLAWSVPQRLSMIQNIFANFKQSGTIGRGGA